VKMRIIRVLWLLIACFTSNQALAQENCRAPGGLESVVADKSIKFIVFGERHGSAEGPALFADAVCSLVKSGRSILVGLELSQGDAAAYEQFLQSAGGPEDVSKLLTDSYWGNDGRGSMAMLNLVQRIQALVSSGYMLSIAAFAPDGISPGTLYESGMASSLMESEASGTYDLVMILVGNAHAFKVAIPGDVPLEPMAMHLPTDETISLLMVTEGGTAWNCQAGVCGVHPVRASPIEVTVDIELRNDVGPGYDGVFDIGESSASPPATGGQ
jgi:hypothetical protein